MLCSALNGDGIAEIWECILRQERFQLENGLRVKMRREQSVSAMRQMISLELEAAFRRDSAVGGKLQVIEEQVRDGRISSFAGARVLLGEFRGLRK